MCAATLDARSTPAAKVAPDVPFIEIRVSLWRVRSRPPPLCAAISQGRHDLLGICACIWGKTVVSGGGGGMASLWITPVAPLSVLVLVVLMCPLVLLLPLDRPFFGLRKRHMTGCRQQDTAWLFPVGLSGFGVEGRGFSGCRLGSCRAVRGGGGVHPLPGSGAPAIASGGRSAA